MHTIIANLPSATADPFIHSAVPLRLVAMKHSIIILAFLFTFHLYAQTDAALSFTSRKSHVKEKQKNVKYNYVIIPSVENTWGYDIYIGKPVFIHQPNLPGLPGNKGFKSKTDAEKVARLVIEKINKGEMPPSISTRELKELKVL